MLNHQSHDFFLLISSNTQYHLPGIGLPCALVQFLIRTFHKSLLEKQEKICMINKILFTDMGDIPCDTFALLGTSSAMIVSYPLRYSISALIPE